MNAIIGPFLDVIELVVDLYFKVVLVEVIMSWLVHFKVFDLSNKFVGKTMEILGQLTHPVYAKIRQKVKPISGFDFSPFILLLGLYFVLRVIYRLNMMLV